MLKTFRKLPEQRQVNRNWHSYILYKYERSVKIVKNYSKLDLKNKLADLGLRIELMVQTPGILLRNKRLFSKLDSTK